MQVFDGVLKGSFVSEEYTDDGSCSSDDIAGSHTVQFLFMFGSSCFERYPQFSLLVDTSALLAIVSVSL